MARVRGFMAKTFFKQIPSTDGLDSWVERDNADYWDFGNFEVDLVGMLLQPFALVDYPYPTNDALPAILYVDGELSLEPKGGFSESILFKYHQVESTGHLNTVTAANSFTTPMGNVRSHMIFLPIEYKIEYKENIYWNISTMQKISTRNWDLGLEVTLYYSMKRLVKA